MSDVRVPKFNKEMKEDEQFFSESDHLIRTCYEADGVWTMKGEPLKKEWNQQEKKINIGDIIEKNVYVAKSVRREYVAEKKSNGNSRNTSGLATSLETGPKVSLSLK